VLPYPLKKRTFGFDVQLLVEQAGRSLQKVDGRVWAITSSPFFVYR
jgi:hypothetical protein